MAAVGAEQIQTLFCGEMGVKTIFVGETPIYDRQGSVCYITLDTKEKETLNG